MQEVSVKGEKFTKTNGGYTDLTWTGAVEYWMVMMIRSIESYGMYTLGDKYFFKNDRGLGMYHRLKALCWAAFALLPMLDLIVPEDWSNPQNSKHKLHDLKFRFPLYWWTVMELYTTVRCIGAISNPKNSFSKVEIASALAMLSFFNGGIGINTSHELLHKNSIFEKVLGYALLMNVNYIHWGEEHLTGHHRNVATPGDPATSRLNETFYQFFPRTLYGSWKSALSIELNRLNMNSQSAWSPIHNRIMWCAMVPMMWAGFILKVTGGGLKAVQYFYIQGFGSATLLELVNYIEHYGLAREKLANGDFEPVNPTHCKYSFVWIILIVEFEYVAWNAPHRLSNSLLYKLQRHSGKQLEPYILSPI